MNRSLLSVLAAVVSLIAAPMTDSAAQAAGRIRVLGHATVEAVPDTALLRVGISNKASTPTGALDQNSASARKIIDFAKRFGIDEADIQTDSVNLSPAYKNVREPNGNTRQEPDGYTASNMVLVKLKDVSKLGAFMRQVLDQGANNIAGVQFGLSERDKLADEARTKAVEDAVRQARLLADAARVRLGTILEIAHPPRTPVQVMREGVADMAFRGKASPVPVETGTVKVSADVEILWAIE